MKYYSERTKKLYNTESDLIKAEAFIEKQETERKAKEEQAKKERAERAKAVENALKEASAARVKANKLMNEFVRDYGSFHTSFTNVSEENTQDSLISDFIKQVFSFLGEE